MIVKELQGRWELYLDGEKQYHRPPEGNDFIDLPDSTAHAGKGTEHLQPRIDCMTDRYYFEGYAWYSRSIEIEKEWEDKKITLFLERTRISTVYVDGTEADTKDSLCGFHVHDLTGKLSAGVHRLTIRVDNTNYPTRGGHMTSPDTQTNWNGILGRIELQIQELCHPENIQVTADTSQRVEVCADICGALSGQARIVICRENGEVLYQGCEAFANGRLQAVLALKGEDLLWDEYHPNLLSAQVCVGDESASVCFGIRQLFHKGRRLFVNDREVFWRGKHDGLVFPKTGYAPMTKEEWKRVLATAKEYGINHYRFHTCCPPDAAFAAADEMGIYMEPELPFWGTIAAPGEEDYHEEEQAYLLEEGYRILREFGNHPSFVMLSMGNELWGSKERINQFLHDYKQADRRHLYTQGSNNFQFCPEVLEEEDVFCGVRLSGERLFRGSYAMCDAPQGHIQTMPPDACHDYNEVIAPVQTEQEEQAALEGGCIEIQYGTGTKKVKAAGTEQSFIPRVPVISHEIGQYDFFPDFTELGRYEGSQQPLYLEIYRERMEKSGIYGQWKKFYQAAGALAVDCYRREIEAALRTRELSGFQLLDLQDFPGQCVALVGVLNAWMESKGLIEPQQWRQFCNDTVILAGIKSFVVTEGETIQMPLMLSVCHWDAFTGTKLAYRVTVGERVLAEGSFPIRKAAERLTEAGSVSFTIPKLQAPERVEIVLRVTGEDIANSYTLWAYPDTKLTISQTEICYGEKRLAIARSLEQAKEYQKEALSFVCIPESGQGDVEGTYCTDFWNYPMFRSISESMKRKVPVGTLGLYIEKEHPILRDFVCESYSTPQWYQLVMHSHAAVLEGKEDVQIVVQPIDNAERCHKLGLLYYQENIPVCTSRLWEIGEYPEVRQFAKSLLEYLSSEENSDNSALVLQNDKNITEEK